MAARVEEFTELYERVQVERALCLLRKRQITVARRVIRARIEAALQGALSGAWTEYLERFEGLLARLPRANASSETLEQVLVWFQGLQGRVEQAYLKAFRGADGVEDLGVTEEQFAEQNQEMNPKEVSSDPHILITNQLDPVTCNRSEAEPAAGVAPKRPIFVPVERSEREGGTDVPKTP